MSTSHNWQKKSFPSKLWSEYLTHLRLPGTTGNYASTPDSTVASVTGDIDIRARVAMDDWSPTTEMAFVSKWQDNPDRGYLFVVDIGGAPRLYASPDGDLFPSVSTDVPGFEDGSAHWIRVTRRVSDGLTQFFTSDGGEVWAQLGTDKILNAGGGIFDTESRLMVGARNVGTYNMIAGKIFYADVRKGIDGPIVAKFDPGRFLPGELTAEMATGEVWTIHQSGSPTSRIVFPREFAQEI